MTWRVGVVRYLNAKPLTWALEQGWIADVEPVLDVPSVLAGQLRRGELDAAMLSSLVALREPDVELLAQAGCIASDGPVQSVRLFCRTDVGQFRRVALDTSSLTSAALVRILLRERYGVEPEYVSMPPDLGAMLAEADAALLIGDPGLSQHLAAVSGQRLYDVIDLGREWRDWTGLPFVFAAWVARRGRDPHDLTARLAEARTRSLAAMDDIVAAESDRLGLDPAVCRHYLTRVIHYELGERERQGLELFGSYLARLELP